MKDTTNDVRKFKDGDIVFVNSTWNTAEKCEIAGYVERERVTNKKPFYVLYSLDYYGGEFSATEDCIFATEEDAISEYHKAFEDAVKSYCEQIKTLEDLVKFPIDNCINGDEYTNYPALEAYKIRSKEIINSIQKKGKWLIEDGGKNNYTFCYCSNCNSYYTIDRK